MASCCCSCSAAAEFFFPFKKICNNSVLMFLDCFFCFFWGAGLDHGGSICLSLPKDIPIVGRMVRDKCFSV